MLRRIRVIFGLESGTDVEGTIERIRNGVRLRGANLWILVCAALIASIGLNTSSVAVIIGAMLISPLMGPILGIGLGIAIHDRGMLFRAVRTFAVAVAISLLTSALYFLATPITSPTAELLARTSPTILDVCIAFFGGVAGIVAGSRREATTAIPGVAIATALMPPLCTAGYGLASGRWSFLLGAFYLFFLNTVFISLATYLIARLLKFPQATYVKQEVKRRVDRLITAFVVITVIPSIVIFYDVITTLRQQAAAERFIRQELEVGGRTAVNWKLDRRDSSMVLRVYLAGTPFDSSATDSLNALLPARGLPNGQLRLVQLNLSPNAGHISTDELLELLQSEDLQHKLVESIVGMMDKPAAAPPAPVDTISIAGLMREMRPAFPTLIEISYASAMQNVRDSTDSIPTFLVRQDSTKSKRLRQGALAGMRLFLQARLKKDTVRVIDIASSAGSKR
ncbi:MAG: DUF389 domain-containing protein [Bacteroidetes bacterium]|nr:DUF389 domain-containing protein [Bacteroidota bacterium]